MAWHRIILWKIDRFIVAAVVIAVATSLRIWPLQILGSRLVWLTFYPAVMVIAIYSGLPAGLLPICSHCKKIRDENGYRNQIDTYINIMEQSNTEVSHGICDDCLNILYPEQAKQV